MGIGRDWGALGGIGGTAGGTGRTESTGGTGGTGSQECPERTGIPNEGVRIANSCPSQGHGKG